MSSNYIFLSHVLSNETMGYGGKQGFRSENVQSMSVGNSCNQSEWKMNNHIGTHVDAPYHFSNEGKTVDRYEAADWIFKSPQLINLKPNPSQIIEPGTWCDTVRLQTDLLILKTDFEKHRNTDTYWAHNPGLGPQLGVWLRKNRPNIRAVGFDFISLTSYDHRDLGKEGHRAFLSESSEGRSLLIIEDMHLENLDSDPTQVHIVPLRVVKSDGSPVTVLAEVCSEI